MGTNLLPHVHFLYYEDCPSHEQALQRLQAVMAEEGLGVNIDVIRVDSQAQAQQLNFPGSPTIRIDGKDIDPAPQDTQPSLSCRAYQLEDGRISPLPSPDMIRAALRVAVSHSTK